MTRINRTNVGMFEITVLNDGALEFPDEIFPDVAEEELGGLLAKAGKSAIETNFNALHIRTGTESILVDTGARDLFGPTAGFLPAALDEAGIRSAEITRLVMTHLHPDHLGGAITPEGDRVFANAELIVSETERNFWTDDANFAGADDQTREFRKLAGLVLDSYGECATLASSGAQVASGVTLVDLPGHTPGHAGIRIDAGGSQFMYVADILHAQDLQLAKPEICVAFDVDKDQARMTRKNTLDMLATDRIMFAGAHFLDRITGFVEKSGSGFKIIPA